MSAAARSPRPKREVQNLSGLLDRIVESDDHGAGDGDGRVSLREIFNHVGRRSYGPLLLFIGLFSISPATIVPGMTWASAGLTLLVAGQMALGMRRVWLPKGALNASFTAEGVKKAVDGLRPWARRIDAFMKPRLQFMADPPFVNLVALLCIAAALATFPLGFIPFAPVAPGLAIVLFGLGMTARDGLLLLLGLLPVAAAAFIAWPLVT